MALGFGIALRDWVQENAESVVVRAIGEDGTGLARPDTFDWPARLEELARDFPPEVLVLSVGSNDAQDLTDADGQVAALRRDSDAWDSEYASRLARSFDAFEDTGTTVVWLGHVRTEIDDVADTNRHIHELATEVAADRPWVQVEDLAELTGSGTDDVSDCLADGLHLTASCYWEAAAALLDRLQL